MCDIHVSSLAPLAKVLPLNLNFPSVLGLDLLYVIWFSGAATAAPNQRTEGVSENNDDGVLSTIRPSFES